MRVITKYEPFLELKFIREMLKDHKARINQLDKLEGSKYELAQFQVGLLSAQMIILKQLYKAIKRGKKGYKMEFLLLVLITYIFLSE